MRLSTALIYDTGINGMSRIQSDLYKYQNQMSTGRRVVTPADDPVAAAQALATEQKQHVNDQFLDNQGNASAQLKELESLMASVGETLVGLKDRWIQAGNGAYDEHQLQDILVDVRAKFDQILGIANNADAHGQYRFAGFQAGSQPFVVQSDGSVHYQGDEGERKLQVETSRFMTVNFSGREFFEGIPQGNGIFVANPAAGNTGSGVIGNGSSVGGAGAFDGQNYTIRFTSATGYDIEDSGGTVIGSGTYTSGADITGIPGVSIDIQGVPAAGDSFTVSPSRDESIFDSLQNFMTALDSYSNGSPEFQNIMQRVGASLEQAIFHINDSRAIVGARMAEVESLTTLDQDLQVQYKQQISDLVDADYAELISSISKSQLQLQAAQQSYVRITGLSLFSM
ncbi:MAG: flagellar hook-associated protein FlgL [Zoogloeaceae bacterium]|jgi:flagellar hook-associated protein 3 FlgL|nr:flagellar hook-associated protein FlgL [Zoogloeaceae bacterium]